MKKLKELYKKKLFQEVIDLCETEISINKDSINYLEIMADSYIALKKNIKGIEIYENIIKKNKENFEILNKLGIAYKNISNFKKAEKNFLRSLEIKSNQWSVIFNLGITHFQNNNFEKAGLYLEKITQIKPDFILGYIFYGKTLFNLKSFSKAEEIYKKGLEYDSHSEDLRVGLSDVYIKLGYTKLGRDLLSKAHGYVKLNLEKNSNINKVLKFSDFIGEFMLNDINLCNEVMNFMDDNIDLQRSGLVGGKINNDIKKTKDIPIHPKKLKLESHIFFKKIIENINDMFCQYTNEYKFLKKYYDYRIPSFNIQKYDVNDHYKGEHCERDSDLNNNRYFAWMIYLNDVKSGGKTCFTNQSIEISPKKGKVLIWPSDWTHSHYASEVKSGEKFILTGWIERN